MKASCFMFLIQVGNRSFQAKESKGAKPSLCLSSSASSHFSLPSFSFPFKHSHFAAKGIKLLGFLLNQHWNPIEIVFHGAQISTENTIFLERGPRGEWGPGSARACLKSFNLEPLTRARGPRTPFTLRTPFKGNCVRAILKYFKNFQNSIVSMTGMFK